MEKDIILDLRDIGVQFGGRTVLKDINVDIRAGEFVGLIGPNGAGKTTLLRVVLGFQRADRGQGNVNGHPLRQKHRLIGYVPQKIYLDPATPLRSRDLVGLGLDGHRWGLPLPRRSRRQQIEEVLEAVNALQFSEVPVGKLSGGEQQRLLIAQALLTNPKLLLLDEPLSNLDIRSAYEVVQLVSRISKSRNIAVVLVGHDINPLLTSMDRVLYLAQGQGVMGTVDDVIQTHVLSRLYGYHVDVIRVNGRVLVLGDGARKQNHRDTEATGVVKYDSNEGVQLS